MLLYLKGQAPQAVVFDFSEEPIGLFQRGEINGHMDISHRNTIVLAGVQELFDLFLPQGGFLFISLPSSPIEDPYLGNGRFIYQD